MSSTTQRTAIVTGAARGIGAATAIRLAADGHAVAVLDLDEFACADTVSAITRPVGARSPWVSTSADAEQVEAAVARVADELGAPTILVNNAGIIRDNLIFRMTVDDWDAVMNVHLRGAFLMTKAVAGAHVDGEVRPDRQPLLHLRAGQPRQVNYSAAKAGLQGFTKTLAIELGRFNVTANAVAPGFIATDMTRQTAERMKVSFEDFIAGAAARSRSAGSASPRTSPTRSRSCPARRPASSPARSSTSPAAPRTDARRG